MRSKKDFELIVTSKYTWLVMIKTPQRRQSERNYGVEYKLHEI